MFSNLLCDIYMLAYEHEYQYTRPGTQVVQIGDTDSGLLEYLGQIRKYSRLLLVCLTSFPEHLLSKFQVGFGCVSGLGQLVAWSCF